MSVRPVPGGSGSQVYYAAAPGERNRLVLSVAPGDAWTLTDAGADIQAGHSCSNLDAHTARCSPDAASGESGLRFLRIELGDGDDALSGPTPASPAGYTLTASGGDGDDTLQGGATGNQLDGDAGDDELVGSPFDDHLAGGAGDDRLFGLDGFDELDGGGGRDELHGGPGQDRLTDGDRDGAPGDAGPGPDVLDGGPERGCCLWIGGDTVSYADRTASIAVNLADAAPDGESGEGDVLTDVESVIGGSAADRLSGDGQRNLLDGGAAADRLRGRGGRDEFRNAGGPTSCGAGRDVVDGGLSADDLLALDCERVFWTSPDPGRFAQASLRAHPRAVAAGRLTYRISCPRGDPDADDRLTPPLGHAALQGPIIRCGGAVRLREDTPAHRLLGSGRFWRGAWQAHRIAIRLTPLGRRVTRHRRSVRATMTISGHNLDPRIRWSTYLRARRPRAG